MNINTISQILFYFGYFVMIINETPVVIRHIYKPALDFRKRMEFKYGDRWHYWHKVIDYVWNFFLFSGLMLSIGNNFYLFLSLFLIYWVPVFILIYIPLILKRKKRKKWRE